MLAFSTALLLLAGAASLGAFSSEAPELQLERRIIAVAPREPMAPIAPSRQVSTPKLVMTYYLVDTQQMMDSFNTMKTELHHREWLQRSAFEVLLVRTPEEEGMAFEAIEKARQHCVCAEFLVEDFRGK
jgi:hypothetical protein